MNSDRLQPGDHGLTVTVSTEPGCCPALVGPRQVVDPQKHYAVRGGPKRFMARFSAPKTRPCSQVEPWISVLGADARIQIGGYDVAHLA